MIERKPTDWEAIEREYRAGQISLRAIGSAFGVAELGNGPVDQAGQP